MEIDTCVRQLAEAITVVASLPNCCAQFAHLCPAYMEEFDAKQYLIARCVGAVLQELRTDGARLVDEEVEPSPLFDRVRLALQALAECVGKNSIQETQSGLTVRVLNPDFRQWLENAIPDQPVLVAKVLACILDTYPERSISHMN